MSCLVNFSVLCGELRERLPLLPCADGQIARLVAPSPQQTPLGRFLAPPCSDFGRSRQSCIIEFAHGVADSSVAATQFVGCLAHSEPNHPVVAAVVAVNRVKSPYYQHTR